MSVDASVNQSLFEANLRSVFGIQLFLDIIRYLGPGTKPREWLASLFPPWSGIIAALAYSETLYTRG